MKYNILCISDIHFGRGDSKRLYEEELEIFRKYTLENIPDAIIITGDLFDRIVKMNEPSSKYCINFINWINELSMKHKIKVRLIKGTKTHDHNQLNNFRYITNTNTNFEIIDEVSMEELFPDINVGYVPEEYVQEGYYDEFYKEKYDIIFGHGTFDIVGFESNETGSRKAPVFSTKLFRELSRVSIFGHIHNYTCSDGVYYVGSYSRGNHGETSNKGFIHLTIDKENYEVKFIENTKAPTYITIDLDSLTFDNLDEKIAYIENINKQYDNVRLITKSSHNDEIDALKTVIVDSNIKLEVKSKVKVKKVDPEYAFILDRTLPIEQMIAKYIKLKYNTQIDTDFINEIINGNYK